MKISGPNAGPDAATNLDPNPKSGPEPSGKAQRGDRIGGDGGEAESAAPAHEGGRGFAERLGGTATGAAAIAEGSNSLGASGVPAAGQARASATAAIAA